MDREQQLDSVTDGILSFHSLNFRILFSGSEVSAAEMARDKILHAAARAGSLPISEIGTRLSRSQPSMTRLIDGIIIEGLIDRKDRQRDRGRSPSSSRGREHTFSATPGTVQDACT